MVELLHHADDRVASYPDLPTTATDAIFCKMRTRNGRFPDQPIRILARYLNQTRTARGASTQHLQAFHKQIRIPRQMHPSASDHRFEWRVVRPAWTTQFTARKSVRPRVGSMRSQRSKRHVGLIEPTRSERDNRSRHTRRAKHPLLPHISNITHG